MPEKSPNDAGTKKMDVLDVGVDGQLKLNLSAVTGQVFLPLAS